jgi:hypothetical protein
VEWAKDIRERLLLKAVYGPAEFMGWLAGHTDAAWWIDRARPCRRAFNELFGTTLWGLYEADLK